MPTMEPPPCTDFLPSSSCMPRPASGDSSRKPLPRSSSCATRSRGSSWPRCSNLSRLRRALGDDLLLAAARTSASRSAMRAALAAKAADRTSSFETMAGIRRRPARLRCSTCGVTARWKPSNGTDRVVVDRREQRRAQRGAAVDLQRDAGDERGRRRQQEHDGRADLGLEAEAAQRHVALELGDHGLHRAAVGVHAAGGDPARRDRVDAHAGTTPIRTTPSS